MHKTGNVVVEGVAIGKIQFLNADYEEQIKRYMTGTEEEEKKRGENRGRRGEENKGR